MPAATLIIPAYNRLESLRLVLAGFARQSERDFEIIVADDGSNPELGDYVREFGQREGLALNHLWQADAGFRKARIVNQAFAAANSDYIICCDSDCVPHRRFIEMHLRLREPGRYLVGRFGVLSERITRMLSEERVRAGWLERKVPLLLWDSAFGKTRRYAEHGMYIPLGGLAQTLHNRRPTLNLLGANFSVRREDLIKVNGYDEAFPCYGAEDLDLGFRLSNAGLAAKSCISQAVCQHLWPPPRPLQGDSNMSLATASRESGKVRCEIGLDQWLHGSHVSSPE